MTLKQWLSHIRSWCLRFPLPRDSYHYWTGLVGSREQWCMICDAHGMDKDISDREIERDNQMQEDYDKIHEKYFGKDDDDSQETA